MTAATHKKGLVWRLSRIAMRNQLGPGLITGAADDDPSGIATYSQAGAQSGLNLLWTMVLCFPLMVAIQMVSALIGRVTGHGLARNMGDVMPKWLVGGLVGLLFIANTINLGADLAAMGEAAKLVAGFGQHEFTIAFALFSLVLQLFIPYRRYAPVLKFMTLSLFAYVATALTVSIPWNTALLAMVWPKATINSDYFLMVVPNNATIVVAAPGDRSAPTPIRLSPIFAQSR